MSEPHCPDRNVPEDPGLPALSRALDPKSAAEALQDSLGSVVIEKARLLRHRPGRRALVEYRVLTGSGDRRVLLGKLRAKGLDTKSYRVQKALREQGVAVPGVLGTVPELGMWLQERLPGKPVTAGLPGPDGPRLCAASAELLRALHDSDVEPLRAPHTLRDEVRILRERLPLVSRARPELERRVQRILHASEGLAREMELSRGEARTTGIHRDFYPDQVLQRGGRMFLLDLDLFCRGDPALDAGNFLAHVTEQALRDLGDPKALALCEEAFVERFVELSGESLRRAVHDYATLTLVRHVHISHRIPERKPFTEVILSLCEERLLARENRQ
ncbi:Phosphotransferase enzyme family [Rubrobacter radiotolerans]|uniref:Aminoglycoside phosphotransferase family protein n=1 Tax=Rubrobacter radiotolerans TaxID=42256 RepID=A0A023X7E7_RUBRA|nr:aminoglycoside phosphotransferase family protein [Rubrobacter radiotolerans]AHY47984.1 Phosphotransferase enzyme family [Rubrobacter radiotolerans]MDX5892623.1 aminoglycoside phosphotransferase family protein [Rubrobacter radiotolerans]SMC07945.1 Phosphotransferase enzyme family protein [Rubrobacter radiotolerans DSM 5868]